MAKKRGRPPAKEKRYRVSVKLTQREKDRFEQAWLATNADDFSAWARALFHREADRILGKEKPLID